MIEVSAYGHDDKNSLRFPNSYVTIKQFNNVKQQSLISTLFRDSEEIAQQLISVVPSHLAHNDTLTDRLGLLIGLYPSIIIRNVFPSTLASHQVAQLIIQQHSSAFFSANILETSIPSDIKSGCLIILPSGQLLLRVDHSTRQRLGLDFPVVSKSKSSKLNSSDHIIAIDLLDPNFTKQSNGNYNGKYRRVQSALGSEHCLEMQLVGCVGKPIFNNEWGLFEARFQRILRDSGSPNATVEFVKSETRFRKYEGGDRRYSTNLFDVFNVERHNGIPLMDIRKVDFLINENDRKEK